MRDAFAHVPVLLHESIQGLNIKRDGIYLDCTFGRGGHSQLILENLNQQGRLIVLDQDPSAVACAEEKYAHDTRTSIIHETYANLPQVVEHNDLQEKIDGVFFDLGVSSPQLDDKNRGFSFSNDGPLDMRMNTDLNMTAADWLASVTFRELVSVLRDFGEEKHAKKIANKIIQERQQQAITSTKRLADIVTACYPLSYQGVHPATRTFQAVRIAINQELTALQKGLEAAFEALNNNGRLVVISFHSLEDRIVKRFIRNTKQESQLPVKMPVMPEYNNYLQPIGKLLRPSEKEIEINTRARSARLRIAEKVLK